MKECKRFQSPGIKQISHEDIMYSIGNIANNIEIIGMLSDGRWAYHGEHFFTYINVE